MSWPPPGPRPPPGPVDCFRYRGDPLSAARELQSRTRPRTGHPGWDHLPVGAPHRGAGLRADVTTGDGPTLSLLPGGRIPPTDPGAAPSPLRPTEAPVGVDDLDGPDPGKVIGQGDTGRLARLPDPRSLAGQLAQAAVEVLAGDRPVAQLLTWLTEPLYQELSVLAPDPVTTPPSAGSGWCVSAHRTGRRSVASTSAVPQTASPRSPPASRPTAAPGRSRSGWRNGAAGGAAAPSPSADHPGSQSPNLRGPGAARRSRQTHPAPGDLRSGSGGVGHGGLVTTGGR